MVYVPGVVSRKVQLAWSGDPKLSATARHPAIGVPLAKNSTGPEGMKVDVRTGATVAVAVTLWPETLPVMLSSVASVVSGLTVTVGPPPPIVTGVAGPFAVLVANWYPPGPVTVTWLPVPYVSVKEEPAVQAIGIVMSCPA